MDENHKKTYIYDTRKFRCTAYLWYLIIAPPLRLLFFDNFLMVLLLNSCKYTLISYFFIIFPYPLLFQLHRQLVFIPPPHNFPLPSIIREQRVKNASNVPEQHLILISNATSLHQCSNSFGPDVSL